MKKLLVLGVMLLSSGAAQAVVAMTDMNQTVGGSRPGMMGGIVNTSYTPAQLKQHIDMFSPQWIQQNTLVFLTQVLPYIRVRPIEGKMMMVWQHNGGTRAVMYPMSNCQYGMLTFDTTNYSFGCDKSLRGNSASRRAAGSSMYNYGR